MKKIILIVGLITIILFSGCNLTPENADLIASSLQGKYDNIDSYQANIVTIKGSDSKIVSRSVERDDKFREILSESDSAQRIEVCNGNTKIIHDTTIEPAVAIKYTNYNCKSEVSNFFEVTDKIKNIFDYNYDISEINTGGQETLVVILSSKEETRDYWSEKFIFNKANYQLIQHSYELMGGESITEYQDLILNAKIPDYEFEYEFLEGVKFKVIDAGDQGNDLVIPESPQEIPDN